MWSSSVHDIENGRGISQELCLQWKDLETASAIEHPFVSSSWMECWLHAYGGNGEHSRLVEVFNSGQLAALVPFIAVQKRYCGINLRCLSFPGNGHSPRGDVLTASMETAALEAIVNETITLAANSDLIIFPAVDERGITHRILCEIARKGYPLHVEHRFETPRFVMSEGWQAFLKSKSRHFRRRITESRKRAVIHGAISCDVYENSSISHEVINRLRDIDTRTWQHQNGTGLFSTKQNAEFYTLLLSRTHPTFNILLTILRFGDMDAAYEIAVTRGNAAYFLKCGFDPVHKDCRPGVLVQAALSECVASKGCTIVDLGPEISEEKSRWESERLKCANYWLINFQRPKGLFLLAALRLHQWIKTWRV